MISVLSAIQPRMTCQNMTQQCDVKHAVRYSDEVGIGKLRTDVRARFSAVKSSRT